MRVFVGIILGILIAVFFTIDKNMVAGWIDQFEQLIRNTPTVDQIDAP
jgi:ABC-type amino acid transport system permease subunit